MTTRIALLLATVIGISALACVPSRASYSIAVPSGNDEQVLTGRLDGTWFRRDVRDDHGRLMAVELTYCPIMPGERTVCRTSTVWQPNFSQLAGVLDQAAKADAE